jgi:hypothetical protein
MAGVYSKAYQTVWAGRVREDEAIGFYGHNEVALPPRVTVFVNLSAQKQPTVSKDFLNTDRVGKRDNTVPSLDTYLPTKVQNS